MGYVFNLLGTGVQLLANQDEHYNKMDELQKNQDLAHHQAADAIARGNRDAGLSRLRGSQLIAQQNLAYANSGVRADVGTAAETQAQTRQMSEFDTQTIENNAAREAWGFNQTADKFKRQADNEKNAYEYRQWGTILGGAGRVAGSAFGSGGGGSSGGGDGGGGGGG